MPEFANDSNMHQSRVIYGDDGTPYIYGQDEYGNPIVVDPSSVQPWWGSAIARGIDATQNIFGGQRRYDGYYAPQSGPGAAVQTQLSSGGLSTGFNLSSNTLLLIGVVAAFFLLGKRGR